MATKEQDESTRAAPRAAKGARAARARRARRRSGEGARRRRPAGPPPRAPRVLRRPCGRKLAAQFGFTNPHEIPNLEKIVLNVGMGEAIKQPKVLDAVVEELAIITGQAPVEKKAKKSIANFGLRQGQEIGAAVTLRGARMWEFFDRFISTAIPRIRDFRGLPRARSTGAATTRWASRSR